MKKTFTDQLGNQITIPYPPSRIISLVPSQTELLATLGLDHEVVGITRFCRHPDAWLASKTSVGGTKTTDLEAIDRLKPDLILANKEENDRATIESLQQRYPVWISDIVTLQDALNMMTSVGSLTGKEAEALQLTNTLATSFEHVKKEHDRQTGSVLYLIWRKPWMGAAANTFIHSMLETFGWRNALESFDRYPELSSAQIQSLEPDFIFLSSEPYPFREKHIAELAEISPQSHILLVDGEIFSWYGSRLLEAPAYGKMLLATMQ